MNNPPDLSGYADQVARLPEVQFSPSILEFAASKLDDKLSQNIVVRNHVVGTSLEAKWEVAPHPSDPPHQPSSHAWITVAPMSFVNNAIECVVTVDTNRLIADADYERQLILHANSAIKTHLLTLRIKTASLNRESRQLPYFSILMLVLTSMTVSTCIVFGRSFPGTWALTWVWSLSVAFAVAGVIAGTGALALAVTFSLVLVLAFALAFAIAGASAWALGWAITGALVLAGGIAWSIVKESTQRGFSKRFSILIALLTANLGISLGIWLRTGLMNLAVVSVVLGTGLPLVAMILYPPLKLARQVSSYRASEQYMIKP